MTKLAEMRGDVVHHIYPPEEFATAEEAYKVFPRDIVLVDAPDWVGEGWGYNPDAEGDERFIAPGLPDGWFWDENGNPWNALVSRENERADMINRADRDVLEAYRAQRNGDTTIDWASWIDALEKYVADVRATVKQDDYPKVVEYPEYPTKPQ